MKGRWEEEGRGAGRRQLHFEGSRGGFPLAGCYRFGASPTPQPSHLSGTLTGRSHAAPRCCRTVRLAAARAPHKAMQDPCRIRAALPEPLSSLLFPWVLRGDGLGLPHAACSAPSRVLHIPSEAAWLQRATGKAPRCSRKLHFRTLNTVS